MRMTAEGERWASPSYYAITSLSRLFNDKRHRKNHLCTRCLGTFRTKEGLAAHLQQCREFELATV